MCVYTLNKHHIIWFGGHNEVQYIFILTFPIIVVL